MSDGSVMQIATHAIILATKQADMKACYDGVLRSNPGAGGKVAVAFEIETEEGRFTNVVVDRIRRLERPDLPVADVRHIEPPRTWSSEAGAELRAEAPAAHSFGRRGR